MLLLVFYVDANKDRMFLLKIWFCFIYCFLFRLFVMILVYNGFVSRVYNDRETIVYISLETVIAIILE